MKFFSLFILVFSLFNSFNVAAGEDAQDRLKQALSKTMPHVKPDKITETSIPGLYEVVVGSEVVYLSNDARYMIQGDLYDLTTKQNISEQTKATLRLTALNSLGAGQMLVYKPETVKDTITVVTDIDCPYCRRLHSEIADYMAKNVEVRYIFMPLKGAADMKKTISVWCADNQQKALDVAKSGGTVEDKTCDNPIKEHMELARELGVRGTPAIILENGEMLPGYVPAEKLVAQLRSK
jgi:thiol:disulfide interchange protein DsbC